MEKPTTVSDDISVEIFNDPITSLLEQAQEQGQVIVHCLHYGCSSMCGRTIKCELRLNPSIQLIPTNGSNPSHLLQAYNINLPPARNFKESYGTEFTLVFSGLPKDCTSFDFIEPDEDGRGWQVKNIKRNKTDVYYVYLAKEKSWEGKTVF
jgi:hypothetical protein